jgi:hypothetical protein
MPSPVVPQPAEHKLEAVSTKQIHKRMAEASPEARSKIANTGERRAFLVYYGKSRCQAD